MNGSKHYLCVPLREGALAARPRLMKGWQHVTLLLNSSAKGLSCSWLPPRVLLPGVALVAAEGEGPVSWLLISAGAVYLTPEEKAAAKAKP